MRTTSCAPKHAPAGTGSNTRTGTNRRAGAARSAREGQGPGRGTGQRHGCRRPRGGSFDRGSQRSNNPAPRPRARLATHNARSSSHARPRCPSVAYRLPAHARLAVVPLLDVTLQLTSPGRPKLIVLAQLGSPSARSRSRPPCGNVQPGLTTRRARPNRIGHTQLAVTSPRALLLHLPRNSPRRAAQN